MLLDAVEKAVAGEGVDLPAVALAVIKDAAGGDDLELGLGQYGQTSKDRTVVTFQCNIVSFGKCNLLDVSSSIQSCRRTGLLD